jgi:hypothetical protein
LQRQGEKFTPRKRVLIPRWLEVKSR